MACYSPLHAFKGPRNSNGRFPLVWKPSLSPSGIRVDIPCGQCIGCRLERSRQWAVRCMHESSLHEYNRFITLTYDNDHLPPGGSLVLSDLQGFIKKLRSDIDYHTPGQKIRFFACGEYGELCSTCNLSADLCFKIGCRLFSPILGRAHYHLIVFGYRPRDERIRYNTGGRISYESESLKDLWGNGHVSIDGVTFDACAYVARYVVKKINGDQSDEHYQGRKKEFCTMSRGGRGGGGGIASGWFEKFGREVYPSDSIVFNSREMKPPKFYDRELDKTNSILLNRIKSRRRAEADKRADDNTPERLAVKEKVAQLNLRRKMRQLEAIQ